MIVCVDVYSLLDLVEENMSGAQCLNNWAHSPGYRLETAVNSVGNVMCWLGVRLAIFLKDIFDELFG